MAVEGGMVGEAWIYIKPYTKDFAPMLSKDVSGSVAVAERRMAAAGAGAAGTAGAAEKAGASSKAAAAATAASIAGTGSAVEKVSHKTRAAYGEVQAAQANLTATLSKYPQQSAEAELANERLSKAHHKLSASMDSNERSTVRLSGRMRAMGHGVISSTGGLLIGGLALEEFGKHVIEASTSYQEAGAQIQANSGATARQVGGLTKAFLAQAKAGETTFTAGTTAQSYAAISGQLKLVEGHVLNNRQALVFMKAAQDDAEASGANLGTTTSALAGTMQAFQIPLGKVTKESDLLFNVSRAMNVPLAQVSTTVDRLHSRLGVAAPTLSDTGALMLSLGKAGLQGSRGMYMATSALNSLLKGGAKAQRTPGTPQQIAAAQIAAQSATDAVITAQKTYGTSSEQYVIATEKERVAQMKLNDAIHGAPPKLTAAQAALQQLHVTVFNGQGKFVGMKSVIEQLQPRLAKMSQSSRELALQTIFGTNAASFMGKVIEAGGKGYQKSTAAVNKQGTAAKGAADKQHTLTGETKILGSEFNSLEITIGNHLIPILTTATTWLTKHQTAAMALAGVIGGVLVLSIARYVGELVWSSARTVGLIAKQIGQWTGLSKTVDETKVKADSAAKSISGAGTKAGGELDAAGTEASAEIGAGASAAGTQMAAGGTEVEAQLAAGGATAEGELAAGGATAEGELAAGGATAEGELAAGGLMAGGAGGLIGKAGLVAAAGIAAYQGTTAILHHLPKGAQNDVKQWVGHDILHLRGNVVKPSASLGSGTQDMLAQMGISQQEYNAMSPQEIKQMFDAYDLQHGIKTKTPKPPTRTSHARGRHGSLQHSAAMGRLLAGDDRTVSAHSLADLLAGGVSARPDRQKESYDRATHGYLNRTASGVEKLNHRVDEGNTRIVRELRQLSRSGAGFASPELATIG